MTTKQQQTKAAIEIAELMFNKPLNNYHIALISAKKGIDWAMNNSHARSVNESLPEKSKPVICHWHKKYKSMHPVLMSIEDLVLSDGSVLKGVTHWQPLPQHARS